MLANTKTVLADIVWEDGFIGPKTTWVKLPELLTGWNDDATARWYIKGLLQGVYGGHAHNFTIREGEND